MKSSKQIRPTSRFKANANKVVSRLIDLREPMVITQNGVAKAVIQDAASLDQTQQTMALLKILVLGNQQIEDGRTVNATEAIRRISGKGATRKAGA